MALHTKDVTEMLALWLSEVEGRFYKITKKDYDPTTFFEMLTDGSLFEDKYSFLLTSVAVWKFEFFSYILFKDINFILHKLFIQMHI